MKIKKWLSLAMVGIIAATMMTGCGKSGSSTTTGDKVEFDTSKDITVVSREDGSGTRGAFIELFGVEEKNADGEKVDNTTDAAEVTNNTSVMMTTVAGNNYSIGYVSLGSLGDSVKAVKIGGVEATVANIKSGKYEIARPFNIATKGDVSEVVQDFIDYIMSAEGQKVIEDNGYISTADNAKAYAGSKPSGKIKIEGSSSVSPVMEKLQEAYLKLNTNATIEINTSDSTTGMTAVSKGGCDIGMASRDLKDSEKDAGLTSQAIAMDGIAVIVNKNNTTDDLTKDQVKNIFTGTATTWKDAVA